MDAHKKKRLLVISHVEAVRGLLTTILRSQEAYDVATSADGFTGIEYAFRARPDLIILDIMTPTIESYQLAKLLHSALQPPVSILILLTRQRDLMNSEELQRQPSLNAAFMTLDVMDFLSRVDVLLRRSVPSSNIHPLLGFPANIELGRALVEKLSLQTKFAIGYAELANLGKFNTKYGSTQGDLLILRVRRILEDAISACGIPQSILRHIDGKNFAFMAAPEDVERICQTMILRFTQARFTDFPDMPQYIESVSMPSLSIAVVTNLEREFSDFIEIGEIALGLQHYLKNFSGSNYVIDRRIVR